MSAYVKYIEASGARVVPLIVSDSDDVLQMKLDHVDGVLFPGGAGDYIDMGMKVLDYAKKMNDQGHFFPLWGTCLGFERLVAFTADSPGDALSLIEAEHVSLPITFTKDPTTTRMYQGLGQSAWELQNNPFLYNGHHFGVKPETMENDAGLKSFWDVTAISYTPDDEKTAFVASVEAKNYPFFGTQYHPEKPS